MLVPVIVVLLAAVAVLFVKAQRPLSTAAGSVAGADNSSSRVP
jgi:hypothetical protein